jgi:hypothetical protein
MAAAAEPSFEDDDVGGGGEVMNKATPLSRPSKAGTLFL